VSDKDLVQQYYEKISELLGQTKVSFLIGAGCSICAGLPSMSELTNDILCFLNPDNFDDPKMKRAFTLLREIKENYKDILNISIEDYMSERLRCTIPSKEIIGEGEPVVIFPSSMKYKETQHDPYDQMMKSFRKAVNDAEGHVLAIIGYGFNDEHINIEISNGIKKSEGALTVVIFCGTENLPIAIDNWIKDPLLAPQILVFGKNGIWKDGERIYHSINDIEWYKFEKLSDFLISGVII